MNINIFCAFQQTLFNIQMAFKAGQTASELSQKSIYHVSPEVKKVYGVFYIRKSQRP